MWILARTRKRAGGDCRLKTDETDSPFSLVSSLAAFMPLLVFAHLV